MIKQLANLVKIAKQKLDTQEKSLLRNQTQIKRKYADIDSINVFLFLFQDIYLNLNLMDFI